MLKPIRASKRAALLNFHPLADISIENAFDTRDIVALATSSLPYCEQIHKNWGFADSLKVESKRQLMRFK